MKTVVGIFRARADAERSLHELHSLGFDDKHVNLLAPGSERELASVPVTAGEGPGMGKAIGSVVGGVAGAAGGMQLVAAAASGFIPGVGPVIAAGLLAGALAGVGGAAIGGALENAMVEGIPKDELYVYEDALRQGRSVVIALTDDDSRADAAREAFKRAGAESLDAARESWWTGIRDAEAATYAGEGREFARDEATYRRGFEMALLRGLRGRSWEECRDECREAYPELYGTDAFRRGFERGRAYHQRLHSDV